MKILKINLRNFRNYAEKDFQFGEISLVLGGNGAGKSNLMEAIYLLAVGQSFRADHDREMIAYSLEFSTISAQTSDAELKITITDRKKFEVNGIPRRMMDFVGKLRAVMFSPTDLEIVDGSPSKRRRYLDFVISQMDSEYRRSLISYEKGLRQRNRLLEAIREGLANRNQLFFWDKLLIKNGDYISLKRAEYLLSLKSEQLEMIYDKSVISEVRLKQYESEEVLAGLTLVGPHRDDFAISFRGRDVAKYASRGEQRMAVLWLKMGETEYLSGLTRPVLLLDDIFSELDHKHRDEVMQFVGQHTLGGGQTIITAADEHLLPNLPAAEVISLV